METALVGRSQGAEAGGRASEKGPPHERPSHLLRPSQQPAQRGARNAPRIGQRPQVVGAARGMACWRQPHPAQRGWSSATGKVARSGPVPRP